MLDNRFKYCTAKIAEDQWWASFKCRVMMQRKANQQDFCIVNTPLLIHRYESNVLCPLLNR